MFLLGKYLTNGCPRPQGAPARGERLHGVLQRSREGGQAHRWDTHSWTIIISQLNPKLDNT